VNVMLHYVVTVTTHPPGLTRSGSIGYEVTNFQFRIWFRRVSSDWRRPHSLPPWFDEVILQRMRICPKVTIASTAALSGCLSSWNISLVLVGAYLDFLNDRWEEKNW